MTEKRFTLADGFKIVAIRDDGEIMNSMQVCDKLNTLAEENEQLKQQLMLYKELYPSGEWITKLTSEELEKELLE